jgi:hypothetical protein
MFVENLAAFFADFGPAVNGVPVSVTVGGVVVSAIFDNGYALGSVGPIGMASSQPMLTLATASVPANPVGTAVVVGAVNYTIGAHEPDGTGISQLMLEAA